MACNNQKIQQEKQFGTNFIDVFTARIETENSLSRTKQVDATRRRQRHRTVITMLMLYFFMLYYVILCYIALCCVVLLASESWAMMGTLPTLTMEALRCFLYFLYFYGNS